MRLRTTGAPAPITPTDRAVEPAARLAAQGAPAATMLPVSFSAALRESGAGG